MNPQDDIKQPTQSYADEVLCANWHPLVVMLAEGSAGAAKTAPDLDVEGFLDRLYSSQEA